MIQSTLIRKAESESLTVSVYSDARTVIHDKLNDFTWETATVALQEKGRIEEGQVWYRDTRVQTEQYPGRFSGRPRGNFLQFTLFGRQERVIGSFHCEISVENEWLVYHVFDLDDSIPSLVYPPPIMSDAIVLPIGVGKIIRETEPRQIYPRNLYPFYSRLNMRWIGGQSQGHAWIGIFDEGFEDSCALVANRTVTPAWMRTLGRWRRGYTFRLKFLSGDYNAIAKCYRHWFWGRHAVPTLRQKIDAKPQLANFLGGKAFWANLGYPPVCRSTKEELLLTEDQAGVRGNSRVDVRFTYAQLRTIIEGLKKAGVNKGFVKIGGWIQGGYDCSHQDIWPPEPEFGDVSELRSLLAESGSLMTGLHDNNQDIYPLTESFPDGVVRLENGELLTGGVWAGGQAYILTSRASLDYARRNWERIRSLEPKLMFIDIVTAMNLYESYEPEKRLSKAEDLSFKTQLLAFYKDQGLILGSEEAADFGVPYLDWFENRHGRIPGVSIPLWPLVFHDAAFCTRYSEPVGSAAHPTWLSDIQWGYMPHFMMTPGAQPGDFGESMNHVSDWHGRVGLDEVMEHNFLDADFSVEQTVFSGRTAVVCNYGSEPYTFNGTTIAPGSYSETP